MMPAGRSAPALATWVIGVSVSAGGLAAVQRLLAGLPATLPAAILIVQHLMPDRPSHLAGILSRYTVLEVHEARSGMRLREGSVAIAPPDAHLLVGIDRRILLSQLPQVHYCRPSGDRLFASLAVTFGARAIAVVLTGCGVDGAAGAQLVRASGGIVVVQQPDTAEHDGMPRAALRAGMVDYVACLDDLPALLQQLVASGGPR
jgi:two-component system, chemotaxis family, protein-glutamate methylesterase/glutaminase